MLQDIILFHAFFTEFIRERNAYYLVSNIIKPLTKKFRFSFAEVVGPVPITFFVSHFWGTGFREFVTCITHHAKEVKMLEATTPSVRPSGLGPPDFSYWVCFLSNNQWKLEEELGDWNESSFYKALSSDLCQATCMVTDTRAMPLTRTWCLFEVLLSFQKQEMGGLYTGLVYCTETGVMSFGNAGYDASVGLARRLSTLNVADATASFQQDKDMIDGLIIKQGGFDKMNFYLRSRAKEAMGTVSAKFSDDMHALESSLSVEQVSEELAFGDLPVEEVPEQVVSQEADSEGNDKAKALAVFNSVPTGGIESL